MAAEVSFINILKGQNVSVKAVQVGTKCPARQKN